MYLLWVPKGEYGISLPKQISTIFKPGFYIDAEKMSEKSLVYLVAQAEKQKVTFVIMHDSPLAIKKKLGGHVFLAYGSRAQASNDVLIYKPENVKNELSKMVEYLFNELLHQKEIKGP